MTIAFKAPATLDPTEPTPKPAKMEVVAENIPVELHALPRFVVWQWRWKSDPGKWDKPPLKLNGRNAQANNPATWCTFGEALAALDAFDGIGFMLRDSGIVGVDLDDCRDPATGVIAEPHASVIHTLDSYAEVSPSGTGVKVLVHAKLPAKCAHANHDDGFEVYDKQYFTLTGHRVPGTPATINDRQSQVEWVIKTFVEKRRHEGNGQATGNLAGVNQDTPGNVALARSVLAGLSASLAEGYWDWLTVGMALHSVSDDLLRDWDDWSRKSTKWGEGACAAKWSTFSRNGNIGLGTLIHLAKQNGWQPTAKPTRKAAATTSHQDNGQPRLLYANWQTEAANATRLVARYGDVLRWCDPWGKWLVWDDKRWKPDDSRGVESFAKTVVASLWSEAAKLAATTDPQKLKSVWSFVRSSNQAAGIRNMAALARCDVPILPAALDTHPWLLNCTNGTLDLRTGTLRRHDKADFITQLCPIPYKPDAKFPTWRGFLDTILAGNRELIAYTQRLVGYCLTGSTREHVLPFLYGVGANGKSTFVSTVLAMLGEDYSIKAPTDLLLMKTHDTHPTERADLYGKRFVACVEAEDGRRLAESLVKELTGGDRVRARRMREDFWEFQATHKIWLAANHKPVVRGTDHGIWRRIKLLPFTVVIPDDQQDKDLPAKLLDELPGILAWSVEGCRQWQQDGLREPDSVRAATGHYREEMDLVGRFITECCVVEPDESVGASALFRRFKEWCDSTGERGVNQMRFGMSLNERGLRSEKVGGRVLRYGIGLPEGDQWTQDT